MVQPKPVRVAVLYNFIGGLIITLLNSLINTSTAHAAFWIWVQWLLAIATKICKMVESLLLPVVRGVAGKAADV